MFGNDIRIQFFSVILNFFRNIHEKFARESGLSIELLNTLNEKRIISGNPIIVNKDLYFEKSIFFENSLPTEYT